MSCASSAAKFTPTTLEEAILEYNNSTDLEHTLQTILSMNTQRKLISKTNRSVHSRLPMDFNKKSNYHNVQAKSSKKEEDDDSEWMHISSNDPGQTTAKAGLDHDDWEFV